MRAEKEGRLTVYGWYYDILTGRIERYDEELRRFVPLRLLRNPSTIRL